MKKSNKILLSTAVAIFVAIPVFAGISTMTARADAKKMQSNAAIKKANSAVRSRALYPSVIPAQ